MRKRTPGVLAILLLAAEGCATVRPWEREHLAKPCMEADLGQSLMAAQYQEKVVESTTGGGLPGQAPGGGCGCTQ
jgi:hypothetical protein